MKKKSSFESVLAVLATVQKIITMILCIATPVLIVIQVLLRYVFQSPLMGIEEMMLFPIIWLYMLGGANASRTRNHIECGILSLYVKKKKSKAVFYMLRITISLIVSCWLTYWAYWYFAYSLKVWKLSPLLKYPMFLGESAILIGLALMTFYTGLEFFDTAKSTVKTLRNDKQEVLKC